MTMSAAAVPTAEPVSPPPSNGPGRPVLFVVLAYALSWAWVIPLVAIGATLASGRGWPTRYPALLGPGARCALRPDRAAVGGTRSGSALAAGFRAAEFPPVVTGDLEEWPNAHAAFVVP